MISITSLTPEIARTLERRAPRPEKRLAAVRALAAAGVPVHVSIAPVVPQITDHEVDRILEPSAEAGPNGASFLRVRIPQDVRPFLRTRLCTPFAAAACTGKKHHQ